MKRETIVQEAPGKSMLAMVFCLLTAMLFAVQAKAGENLAEVRKSSSYVSLGKPMVLNLSGGKRLTFLQISADVLLSDSSAQASVEAHVPAMRHSLIMLLSEQNAADIKSPEKREEIRQLATARVKGLVSDLSGSQDISEVLFSSILVQ